MTETLARGSAAHRLRRIAEVHGLHAAVDTVVAETRGERGRRLAPAPVRRPVAAAATTTVRGPMASGPVEAIGG